VKPKKDEWRADPDVGRGHSWPGPCGWCGRRHRNAGYNSSVNNAFQSVRRGEVVLFGIRGGDFQIEDFSKLILRAHGQERHWPQDLRDLGNHETSAGVEREQIQKKIWEFMLNKGRTHSGHPRLRPGAFEKKISTHPKILTSVGVRKMLGPLKR